MKKVTNNDDARTRMIQVAFDLFHKQGVNATSVDEILENSGTGKSQFYHYFTNKAGLVHAVVEYFLAMLKDKKLPIKYEINTWKDLEEWFDFFVQGQISTGCTRGCPMASIAYELTGESELIRQDINLVCEYTRKPLLKFFHAQQASGKMAKSVDPEALADFCYSIVQGGLVLSKIQKDSIGLERSVGQAIKYLKSFKI